MNKPLAIAVSSAESTLEDAKSKVADSESEYMYLFRMALIKSHYLKLVP
jgi:hypothetical protein